MVVVQDNWRLVSSGLEVDIFGLGTRPIGIFQRLTGYHIYRCRQSVSKDSFDQFIMSKRVYVRHADLLGALGHLDGFL